MKNLIKIFVLVILTLTITNCSGVAEENTLEKTTFWASLDCEKCKTKLFNNIPHEAGVKDLAVDVKAQKVTVVYDKTKTDKEKMKKAIENLGYETKELEKKK
ncbi:MAG: heavy-metal-associated domain-containing protein [Melioribacteraceae bacterium]|nr:heavy-metal-associated domain-containing protein [Melioribacteraceae bacterium]